MTQSLERRQHKMITNNGLNIARTALSDEVDTGIAGTGTATPIATDTALESPVSATEDTASITLGTRAFQVSHTILSTTATGNSFTEWGILDASDTLISRAVTAGVSHTENDEITKITTISLVRQ